MNIRYAKKNEKNIAIQHWKKNFKDSNEEIKFYFDNIFNYKNYLILEENNKIISSLHQNPYIINFFSNKINTKYIVGVSTLLEEQGKGYMSKLIIQMLKKLKEKNFPLIFLTPINPNIYRKFGFEYFSKIKNLKFNINELANFKRSKDSSFFEINLLNKDEYINDLINIYDFSMKNMLCFLQRNYYYFNKLLLECLNEDMYIYISYLDKIPESYIIFSKSIESIEIREVFSKSYQGYQNILSIIYGYRDYYNSVNLFTSINSNIEYIFNNQLNIQKIEFPFMMMRILDPLTLLNLCPYFKIEGLKIFIEDNIINENSGVYSFSTKWSFNKKLKNYSFKINIQDLVFLLTGFLSFQDLIFMEKISLKDIDTYTIMSLKNTFFNKFSYLYEFQ